DLQGITATSLGYGPVLHRLSTSVPQRAWIGYGDIDRKGVDHFHGACSAGAARPAGGGSGRRVAENSGRSRVAASAARYRRTKEKRNAASPAPGPHGDRPRPIFIRRKIGPPRIKRSAAELADRER